MGILGSGNGWKIFVAGAHVGKNMTQLPELTLLVMTFLYHLYVAALVNVPVVVATTDYVRELHASNVAVVQAWTRAGCHVWCGVAMLPCLTHTDTIGTWLLE